MNHAKPLHSVHSYSVDQNLSQYSMGVNQLSKKLRPADKTPDSFANSEILNGKTKGVDVSVVLHKGLGTDEGVGQYIVWPKVTNIKMVNKCTRLCGYYAKANNIILKVSLDGKYHPMKDAENDKRNSDRDIMFAKAKALFQSPDIESKTKDAAKLMKKAV